MAIFCGNCGTSNDSGSYCYNCGQPLAVPPADPTDAPPAPAPGEPPAAPEEPSPTLQFPAAPAPPSYPSSVPVPPPSSPPPDRPPGPGVPPVQPLAAKVNPFVGWPVGDYLRDAAAAFCLFASLGMTWEIGRDPKGGDQWWVVISVLLSLASLALPYLCKAQVIPGWTPLHYRLAKLGANVPLVASVLAVLINELVNVGEDFEGGIGVAVGMGLAGVALAVQPRQADDPMQREDPLWNRLGAAFAIAAVAVGMLMFAGFVLDTDDLFDEVPGFFAVLAVSVIMLVVMAGWPMAGYLGGSAAWRRVFSTSTFTLIGTALLAEADDGSALFFWPQIEKWYGALGFGGTFLIGAAAGLSVARPLSRRAGEQTDPVPEWMRTASSALLVTAAGSVVLLVALVLGIVVDSDDLAPAVVVAVLVAVIAGCTGYASALLRDARKNRILALGLIGGSAILGLVVMGVVNGQDMNVEALYEGPSIPVTGWVVAAWVTLPLLAAYALTIPKPVRMALGPLVPPQPGYPQAGRPGGYPQQQQPAQPPTAPPPSGPPPARPPSAPPSTPPPASPSEPQ